MSRLRLAPVLLVAALSAPLAGCGGASSFDPTDMFNFLDSKKPLPGERKAVFPEGVPGVDRGVPPDMIKGSPGAMATRQQIEQAQQPQFQPQQQPEPAPTQTAVAPAVELAPPAASPPPPAARPKAPTKRRSVTVPPPDPEQAQPAQQQAQPAPQPSPFPSPFPSPVPSGTFTR